MIKNAMVNIPYNDFNKLITENNELKEKAKELQKVKDMTDEEFESSPLVKGLDEICNLLEEASKHIEANEKQYYVYEAMVEYCNIFEIPTREYLEDIPKGTKGIIK